MSWKLIGVALAISALALVTPIWGGFTWSAATFGNHISTNVFGVDWSEIFGFFRAAPQGQTIVPGASNPIQGVPVNGNCGSNQILGPAIRLENDHGQWTLVKMHQGATWPRHGQDCWESIEPRLQNDLAGKFNQLAPVYPGLQWQEQYQ